jgi:hypothetical protein
MSKKTTSTESPVPALKVHQWLESWNSVNFDPKQGQGRPPVNHFLIFSLKATSLKALTGVYRRSTGGAKARALDPNVQRGHEEDRSTTIREFVRHGFPWCEMGEAKREAAGADDLRKPGWLPTAILINILLPGEERNGNKIPENDLVHIEEQGSGALVHLPKTFHGPAWEPNKVFPFEVIDGQHRLWAFEDFDDDTFELPVVAFQGLSPGWQAYLFWSVNITPKKINRSLAFDLYPLLRQQTWLDKFSGHSIYRDTRCQELVEALWSFQTSVWYQRINMLGETKDKREYKGPSVTQAAWIRSLGHTFVKTWDERSDRIGGLFGSAPSEHTPVIPWNRPMQAAFLIFAGQAIQEAVKASHSKWALFLRDIGDTNLNRGDDPAFYGSYSLLSTDQGIRGILYVMNDLCLIQSSFLQLADWSWESIAKQPNRKSAAATDEEVVTIALKSLTKEPVVDFLTAIARQLATYDWRTSSTPELTDAERLKQAVFRGSSGYKELRMQLLDHLAEAKGLVGKAAISVKHKLGLR